MANSVLVNVSDAIPQNIAFGREQEARSLANGKLWTSDDTDESRVVRVWNELVGVLFGLLKLF